MKKSVLLMIAAVAFAAPALAEDVVPASAPSAQAPTAQGDAPASTSSLDQVVCKKMPPPTGTRLGSRRVCQTEREWRDLMLRSQENITHSQQKGAGYGGPGG
jgi:Flp pilus assembly protein CpaB